MAKPVMGMPYVGSYGNPYGRNYPRDWYTPYVNSVYPPQPPPMQNTQSMGSGFGNVQPRGRGALDWLIPAGFLGHLPGRNLFGRPIGGVQPASAASPNLPMSDYQAAVQQQIAADRAGKPPPGYRPMMRPLMQSSLGTGFGRPQYMMRDQPYLTRPGRPDIYKARMMQ